MKANKSIQKLNDSCSSTFEPQEKIFHRHGRYDYPQDIVLTEDDYKSHYLSQRGFMGSLEAIIKTRPFVFIGSGVNVLDFLQIMKFIEFDILHTALYQVSRLPSSSFFPLL
ncbi:MAG: SIR2 family protein [Candidatus Magnetobacterium sp. LHC-1]|uniref:SIR2 family protein n=1 Tax=Candidatus Magnetobacterium casense TaxID=1455061 RepID=A0ABS6S1S1_9BACT|nr:SIR2 family protein [Nitrospirota bacterium]MBV6342796.1 SIR2 family protein [Candidatus Magnetobacterium casensis]